MRAAWLALFTAGCLAAAGSGAAPDEARRAPPSSVSIPVFFTGGERGALEPCGCATGQLGGLARRFTALAAERPRPDAALTLSCGGLLRDTQPLDALTLETAMAALAAMSYDAHVPSSRELCLGRAAVERAQRAGVPWLAANVTSTDPGQRAPGQPLLVKSVGGQSVAVLGLTLPDGPPPRDYALADPLATLRSAQLPPDAAVVVVLAGPTAAARELMTRAGSRWADALVLVGDARGSPTTTPLDGHVLSSGERGHFLLVGQAGHAADAPRVIPLDESWPPDPSMGALVAVHRERIVMEGLLDDLYERTDPPDGRSYVGSLACADCHAEAAAVHAESKHGHALEPLLPNQRFLDPDCLACHTTGFGSRSGYAGRERTPDLARVGCESCHGPGSAHVAAPFESKLSKAVHCTDCHDVENSPAFDRTLYWPKIQHGF